MDFFSFDLATTIKIIGTAGVAAIVFAESGLLIGFFLPGDSLLFTAGFLASQGYLYIIPLILATFIAAVLGDNVGYSLGHKYGRRVFSKEHGYFFNKKRLAEAENFYKKHGAYTIVLARFTPFVRTFAPILAGVGKMPYRTFFIYNVAGGFGWTFGITGLGYFFGNLIPSADRYILLIIGVIVATSLIPGFIKFAKK
jgi:membrane-associated protein